MVSRHLDVLWCGIFRWCISENVQGRVIFRASIQGFDNSFKGHLRAVSSTMRTKFFNFCNKLVPAFISSVLSKNPPFFWRFKTQYWNFSHIQKSTIGSRFIINVFLQNPYNVAVTIEQLPSELFKRKNAVYSCGRSRMIPWRKWP